MENAFVIKKSVLVALLRCHWSKVGTAVNVVRAEYMISRVYCAMKRGEPALFHAQRCFQITKKNQKKSVNVSSNKAGAEQCVPSVFSLCVFYWVIVYSSCW
ncbi:MAG: hypothetical protein HXS54_16515 [Theionarchaea archaeon]|nr:hypothetical protein [Theionarchaea archaeon]